MTKEMQTFLLMSLMLTSLLIQDTKEEVTGFCYAMIQNDLNFSLYSLIFKDITRSMGKNCAHVTVPFLHAGKKQNEKRDQHGRSKIKPSTVNNDLLVFNQMNDDQHSFDQYYYLSMH